MGPRINNQLRIAITAMYVLYVHATQCHVSEGIPEDTVPDAVRSTAGQAAGNTIQYQLELYKQQLALVKVLCL